MKTVYLDRNFRAWVLGGIVRETISATSVDVKTQLVSTRKFSPRNVIAKCNIAKIAFKPGDIIVNQGTLFKLIDLKTVKMGTLGNLRCYYTHDSSENQAFRAQILSNLDLIFVMNHQDFEELSLVGIEANRIKIIYGAIDSKKFFPRAKALNTEPYVYVTGDAKGRKNPDKVIELIRECPEIRFIINGRYWPTYFAMRKLSLNNTLVMEFDSNSNPQLMRNASCLLSLSLQEGGPYPTLEALASGTPVVATPTGWNPELITRENGRIVPFETPVSEIKPIVIETMRLKNLVQYSDLTCGKYSWEKLARLLYEN